MGLNESKMTHQLTSRLTVAVERLPTTLEALTSKKRARPPPPTTSSSASNSEDEAEPEQDPLPLCASSPLPDIPPTPRTPNLGTTTPQAESLLEPEITLMEEDRPVASDPLCPVCVRPTKTLISFRCNSCRVFWERLVTRHKEGAQLKTACDSHHDRVGHTCVFCRRSRYEFEFRTRYPNKPLPIPSVLRHLTAEDGGSQGGGGCKPPGNSTSSGGEDSGVLTLERSQSGPALGRSPAEAPRTSPIPDGEGS
uniref:Uncharacterized protein n=1 Tax=Lygus hesperus TaxID=30085 RepID=A0A0A9WED7_LYGHE